MSGRARLDGREVAFEGGATVLDVARREGIDIPTLCHVRGLAPDGGCRVCEVEVTGASRPRAACHTPLEDGMEVTTTSDALERLRRDVLELWMEALPEAEVPATSEFAALLARCGVETPAVGRAPSNGDARDDSHAYLRFDAARCIHCRRCVRVCEDLQGQFVYALEGRGAGTRLAIGASDHLADSECTACGACVDVCPTDALFDRDREEGPPQGATTRTTCGYCGVGCQLDVVVDDGRVQAIRGTEGAAVNGGHLCSKGRYAHGWQRHPDRLTTPLVRRDGELVPASWDEAIAETARRLAEVRDRHGPDALGAMSSSRSTNEAAYLLQKLFRIRIGTNNVDCCARVCHSSTALALGTVTGTGAASASYEDIERAGCIAVVGANPTEAHPVVGARIKQAVRRGAKLVVIDPRRIELVEYAEHWLPLRAGTNVALFNAIAKVLIDEGLVADDYVAQRTEGWDELVAHLASRPLDELARQAHVDAGEISTVARLLGGEKPVLFVHGLGLSELTQGTASVMGLCNLGMLTGSIGRPGAGMLPLRGQNNVQGNADMGGMPDRATGYQRLDDPAVRERLREVWGAAPPEEPGLTIPEMLEAAGEGRVHALWIQGEDVAQSDPQEDKVLEALERLDLLVVQELFLTETARRAHVVFPAAGFLEQAGTFTNGERRIQRVVPVVPAPGEARPDWEVIRDVGAALGAPADYRSPAEVLDEIRRAAPSLFGGARWDRLEPDGIQWPCPDPRHPGTSSVHTDGFLRGRGQLTVLDFAASPEHDVEGFPFLLITGRVLQHYNVGTMTRRTPHRELAPDDRLEIHPDDATRAGIEDGALVSVASRWGRVRARAKCTGRVVRGTLFLSFHYPETHTNRLVGPHVDPESKCPEYKVVAVDVSAA